MYLFYVDESGSANLADTSHRYFALAAVGIREDKWAKLNAEITQIKRLIFRGKSPELKSVWFRNTQSQSLNYLQPYGITAEDLSQGVDALYGMMTSEDFIYCGVVVDKQKVLADTTPARISPETSAFGIHLYAYRFLLESLNAFLQKCPGEERGLLVHDMVQARDVAASGNQANLKEHHAQLSGVSPEGFLMLVHQREDPSESRMVGEMHFENSQTSNFLQVADLAAYNLLRQFQVSGDEWETIGQIEAMTQYPYFTAMLPRYAKSDAGSVKDFGICRVTNKASIIAYEKDADGAPEWFRDDTYFDLYDAGLLDSNEWRSMHVTSRL